MFARPIVSGLRCLALATCTVCVTVLLVTGAEAANPSFGGISPIGAQRGTEIDVLLGGGSLADAQSLYFYEPGIEVKSWEVVNDGQVKAKLAIAAAR